MDDSRKTKKQLIDELMQSRERVAQLEKAESERKRMEDTFQKSEEQFSHAFHRSPAGMTITHLDDGKFIDANKSFLDIFGFTRDEVIGSNSIELNILSAKARADIVEAQIEAGGLRNFEIEARTKSGETVIVLISSTLVEEDGDLYHITTLIDITERKQAEKTIILSEERLRLSTELANVAVWEYDLVENRMARSDNHDQLYGLEKQDVWVIDTFLDATHPDDRERSNRIIQESINPGGPDHYNFDFRVIWPDESVHWLSVSGEVVERDENGNGQHVRGCLIDITERKQAEETIKKLNEELEERVLERTHRLNILVKSMTGREVRMAELKKVIETLRRQLIKNEIEPAADDPLKLETW